MDPTETAPLPSWATATDQGYRLLASRELATGRCYFPPIPASSPLAARYESITLSGRATLYSHTVIHASPKANQAPRTLVYGDFAENVRVFGRFHAAGGALPCIGHPLNVAFSRDAQGALRYSFTPA